MSKNTDRLLEGYELKNGEIPAAPGNQKPGETPLAEGESYTISDKPDKFVCRIFNSLQFFEKQKAPIIAKIYMFAATLIVTILFWLKQQFLSNLPAIEVIFVSFLVTFIFNYYLINGALYKPFIENEKNSMNIKLCGGFAVAAIACFFYALTFIQLQTALAIFYSAFFLVVLIQSVFLKETYKTNEIFLGLGALVGVFITISASSGTFWSQGEVVTPNSLYGFGLSAASAIFMALIMVNFSKLHTENFATMNHIFTMMIVLFTPIFFPIQGVVTPTLGQWAVLVFMGILTAFATLFFIRSFQIETGGRTAVFMFLQIAFFFIIDWIVSGASGFGALVGAVITIACVGKYSKESTGKISAQGNFAEREEARLQEMIVMNRSDEQ
jgi:drug/metabolite transporter (DMT)-like permease